MAKLGLHSLAFIELWEPDKAAPMLERFHGFGVRVIETPLLDFRNYDAKGTARVIEAAGMEVVCSLGLPEEINPLTSLEAAVDYLRGALSKANEAGAKSLSGVTYGTIGKTSGAPRTAAEVEAITRLLDAAGRYAKALGMSLGIEPCNRYETHLLNTGAQTRELIESTGLDNLFIHLDSYHMNIEEAGFASGFADATPYFGYLHLSESNRGVPGHGTLDWPSLFEGLVRSNFDGVMTLESFVYLAPEIASGLAVWRPVTDKPDDVITMGLPFLRKAAEDAGIVIELG